ncbi:MAG TPA: hypothetical protein VNF72_10810, partial [Myxococcota bacterium]|nr:hypothetical protein [Myxococcota bacterium]
MLAALRARRGALWTPSALARALAEDPRAVRAIRRILRGLEQRDLVERVEGRFRARRDDGAIEARVESRSVRGDAFAIVAIRRRVRHPAAAMKDSDPVIARTLDHVQQIRAPRSRSRQWLHEHAVADPRVSTTGDAPFRTRRVDGEGVTAHAARLD